MVKDTLMHIPWSLKFDSYYGFLWPYVWPECKYFWACVYKKESLFMQLNWKNIHPEGKRKDAQEAAFSKTF